MLKGLVTGTEELVEANIIIKKRIGSLSSWLRCIGNIILQGVASHVVDLQIVVSLILWVSVVAVCECSKHIDWLSTSSCS